jgi:diphthine-ammonia ligase
MKVGILFSGGKDSTFAIQYAMHRDWSIEYLLSIKPTRKDCFLFHYATVENTPKVAEMLGVKHFLLGCDVADPQKEAEIVRDFVLQHKVDAIVLGGTGLQLTQLKSLQDSLHAFGVEVFAAHAGHDHDKLIEEMLKDGYRIMITQVATDGGSRWLGREITNDNFDELKKDSEKYGFHIGFEGGYMDTFVLDAPIFPKKIDIIRSTRVMDDEYSGHIIFDEIKISDKIKIKKNKA